MRLCEQDQVKASEKEIECLKPQGHHDVYFKFIFSYCVCVLCKTFCNYFSVPSSASCQCFLNGLGRVACFFSSIAGFGVSGQYRTY